MKRIGIDIISVDDVRIYIDDEKLEDVDGFFLKISPGKAPEYFINRKMIKEKEELKIIETQPKWRTIKGVIETLKAEDANTAITEALIRDLIRKEKIGVYKNGVKAMVDLEEIKRYLSKNAISNKKETKIKAVPVWRKRSERDKPLQRDTEIVLLCRWKRNEKKAAKKWQLILKNLIS